MREAAGLMRRELADLLGLPVVVVKLAEAGRVGLVGVARPSVGRAGREGGGEKMGRKRASGYGDAIFDSLQAMTERHGVMIAADAVVAALVDQPELRREVELQLGELRSSRGPQGVIQ
jgi:hypothetical protein